MRFTRTVRAVVACTAAAMLIAGCATDGQAVKAGLVSTSSTDDGAAHADSSKVHRLTLGPDAFPKGYRVQEVPRDQIRQMLEEIRSGMESGTVTPAHCVQPSTVPETVDVDSVGLVIATKSTGASLGESVAAVPDSLDTFREQVSGDCAQMTVQMSLGGESVTSDIDSTLVPAPESAASDSFVVEMETTAEAGTVSVRTRALYGYAEVGGYLVTVQSTAVKPGTSPDRDVFGDVFTAAVAKVARES